MDVEAELIRAENWTELKRYYSGKAGHAWELAWVHLLKSKDITLAVEQFTKALNDPRYDEAAHILLWRLGKRPLMKPLEGPPSLKLYDAYISNRAGVLLHYLQESVAHQAYLPFLFQNIVEKMTLRELSVLSEFPRPASFSLVLAEAYDRKWKDYDKAKLIYDEFFSDPWTKRVIEENARQVFDDETSRRIRLAYAQKDGIQLKKILSSLITRFQKTPSPRGDALKAALEFDLQHLTQNILGFPFWKESELSPRALRNMREALFSKEEQVIPPFVKFWNDFFTADSLINIPASLDPNSLSLWQIRVELNSDHISEALLRFPQEERLLFLWSLRQRERDQKDPRRWPAEEKESSVVRKGLEKAFERSTNKVLWFDRLRASGCSQDFYEYAVQRALIPIQWVIEDLEKDFISNTPAIRLYLRDQLSVTAPSESGSHLVNPTEFLRVIAYLTPAEKQQVLLSRFILSDIPPEVLNDEFMELFFEARTRVSPETFSKWQIVVLERLSKKLQQNLTGNDWRWIELAWETDKTQLEKFAPTVKIGTAFPWESYLEKLEAQGLTELFLMALSQIPDERLKESWIRQSLNQSLDYRIYKAITTLKTEHIRVGLLAEWFERKGELDNALGQRELELQSSPILNDQIRIAKRMIEMVKTVPTDILLKSLPHLESAHSLLELNGGLDENASRDIGDLYCRSGQYEKAFNTTVGQWNRSSLPVKEELLHTLLERAFQARAVEPTQRLLVDFIFEQGTPDSLTYEILGALLDPDSVFKLRHLRREFVDRASQIYPLHREVLMARSAYDYRACLLWKSFYGDQLEQSAQLPSYNQKRKYELWQLTESVSHVESASTFAKYLYTLPKTYPKKVDKTQEFLEKARRSTARLLKQYGIKKNIEVHLSDNLENPIQISLRPRGLELKSTFFKELDEEMWCAISVGAFQVFDDYEKGLFDEKHLMERFFQGMLLSGAPIAKLIRLWVWFAMNENLIEPTVLRADPETLIEKLPLINSLLIFYLSSDFSEKMEECALNLS